MKRTEYSIMLDLTHKKGGTYHEGQLVDSIREVVNQELKENFPGLVLDDAGIVRVNKVNE